MYYFIYKLTNLHSYVTFLKLKFLHNFLNAEILTFMFHAPKRILVMSKTLLEESTLRKVMPCQVSCQVSSKTARKGKGTGAEKSAAAEVRMVGRPARSTDVHSMHRMVAVDRPVDRRGSD